MTVSKRSFGTCKCGKEIFLYTLKNANGMIAEITDYGANLVNLVVPDSDGVKRDVVLGFDKLEDYYGNGCFFGAVIGPNANRIENGHFEIDGIPYQTDKNDGINNLHSHIDEGYHKRYFEPHIGGNSLAFSLEDNHTMGFPGRKTFSVTYTLTEDNQLQIHYEAESDKNTIINPTNHSYFNLDGHNAGSIVNHTLQIFAKSFTPVLAGGIPTGEIRPVADTPFDFNEPRVIGRDIDADCQQLKLTGGYDHNWVLDGEEGTLRKIAAVTGAESGITMEVYTDLPGVQFYAGNFIIKEDGKEGAVYHKRDGLCLETQYFPNAVNQSNFSSPIFGPNRKYESTTIYKFC